MYQLVRSTDSGKVITGPELEIILIREHFSAPVMPPNTPAPAYPEKRPGESWPDYTARCQDWKRDVFTPWEQGLNARKMILDNFTAALQSCFLMAKYSQRKGPRLVTPPRGKYESFAQVLTGYYSGKPVADPIAWICYKTLSQH